jgi:hypothetical protein
MAKEYINKSEVLMNAEVQEGQSSAVIDIPANTAFITVSALDHDRIILADGDGSTLMIIPAFSAGTSIQSFITLPIADTQIKFRIIDKTNGNPANVRIYVTRFYAG